LVSVTIARHSTATRIRRAHAEMGRNKHPHTPQSVTTGIELTPGSFRNDERVAKASVERDVAEGRVGTLGARSARIEVGGEGDDVAASTSTR
ncbi:MAG: hypothetical protein J0626_07870, partial [Rhodospirillaceae bacterium]|nr:hypothetical protein [Rhodospirillaceae bacterium]